jgi:hypothetical protein
MLLAGCSASQSSAPTPAEARVALQLTVDDHAQMNRVPSPPVDAVAIGTCTPAGTNTLICDTRFTVGDTPQASRVGFWTTPNPDVPWRARILPNRSPNP